MFNVFTATVLVIFARVPFVDGTCFTVTIMFRRGLIALLVLATEHRSSKVIHYVEISSGLWLSALDIIVATIVYHIRSKQYHLREEKRALLLLLLKFRLL